MLVRSAGRRQRRNTARVLSACFAQLNLPWLAPAQLRWSATQAPLASQAPGRIRRRSSSLTRPTSPQARHLATATDQYTLRHPGQYLPPGYNSAFRNSAQDRNIPWDLSQSPKASLSSVQPYSRPIILNTRTQAPDQTIKVANGVSGSALELLQHLDTALRVGRLGRAEAIIRRLGELRSADSAEMMHAHTAYLEEALKTLSLHGRGERGFQALEKMQRWFEVEVKQKGVAIDSKLLIVMIRASIKALTDSRRDRSIRRYLDMARELGDDAYYNVVESEEYDDNEFTILQSVAFDGNQQMQTSEGSLEMTEERPQESASDYTQRSDVLPLKDVPEVTPTAQRGSGLSGIKQVLKDYAQDPHAESENQREEVMKRQEALENASVQVAIERWRQADQELKKLGIHTSMQSKPINALMWQWYQALLPVLEVELAECKKLLSQPGRSDHDRYHYGPYLEIIPLNRIAANTILFTMMKLAGQDNRIAKSGLEVKLPQVTLGLARAIEEECKLDVSGMKASSFKKARGRFKKHLKKEKGKKLSKAEQNRQALLAKLEWPLDASVKLGAMLVSKLIETAQLPVTAHHPRTKEKITRMQPAFLHRFKFERGKKAGVLSPNPALTEKIESEPVGGLIAKRMPMIVQPKPWTEWNKGGYMLYSNPIMRLRAGETGAKEYFMAAHARGDMDQIYAGLSALGEVPWKVHHGVFKVQLEAWNSGEKIAKLAPLHPKFDAPPEPGPSADPSARVKWLAEMRDLENQRIGLHSQRCFQNFQMEISRAMVNENLYFPHNMDFRGRAYPIPPYLNHMGADNVRGLLVFANGKELGEDGLRWLKIHLATVAGHDKASMAERIEFTMNHLDDIYDSARDPLGGGRWWLQSEDAWQTLAACFELTAALDSPDPIKFVSRLPVQQDGTCNGLQHYAALGGDNIGAAQVNLQPGDRPADVYTAVAEAVKTDVREDAARGNPIAKKLDGRITRKCVKQPVMTNVYGVTWHGAKEQVQKQLEVIFPEVRKFDEVNLNHMSQYIATKIFKSLGTMFGGAQSIQHWLGQCAERICTALTPEQIQELASTKSPPAKTTKKGRKSKAAKGKATSQHKTGTSEWDRLQQVLAKPLFRSTVVWTTPLRLPVVQPYRAQSSRSVPTTLQAISLQEPHVWHPVDKRKQLQAFPPNFIHSLDATHMLLSALRCKELGVTFASVHDSFWTHACDVDRMSIGLRDAFVDMHSDNIVERLREEFQTRYHGYMYLATVLARSPVGEKISALRKEANDDGPRELAKEAKRMQLLESENPEERAEGEKMITPGSIMASEGDESAFAVAAEISSQKLGTIPENAQSESMKPNSDDTAVHEVTAAGEEGVVGGSVLDTPTDAAEFDAPAAPEEEPVADVGKSGKPKKQYHRKLYVWLPLTFPEVPPKGEFDVRKIRESNYFFH